jgi:hypothetical protein
VVGARETEPKPWGWVTSALSNFHSSTPLGPTLLLNSDVIRALLGASALDRCVGVGEWGWKGRRPVLDILSDWAGELGF